MATQVKRPSVNGVVPKKPANPRAPVKKPAAGAKSAANGVARPAQHKAQPIHNKAYSVAGGDPVNGVSSAYSIMASRIANRVAEMAEGITFVER